MVGGVTQAVTQSPAVQRIITFGFVGLEVFTGLDELPHQHHDHAMGEHPADGTADGVEDEAVPP